METTPLGEQRFSVEIKTPTVLCPDHTSTDLEIVHWISVRVNQTIHKQVIHETLVFPLILFATGSAKVLPPYEAGMMGTGNVIGRNLESAVICKDICPSRRLPEYSLSGGQKVF